MFVVVFEVEPRKERFDDYLALARALKPRLEAIPGFIDNERFLSRRTEGRLLSLSTWRDEKAVVRWRSEGEHHHAQERGRFELFRDYRLRVGEVTDDSDPPPGIPVTEQHFEATENPIAKALSITEQTPREGDGPDPATQSGVGGEAAGAVDSELFESIYQPGKLLRLVTWRDVATAGTWRPTVHSAAGALRHRRVRVVRDYGRRERDEAPQFFPAVGADG